MRQSQKFHLVSFLTLLGFTVLRRRGESQDEEEKEEKGGGGVQRSRYVVLESIYFGFLGL